MMVVMNKDSQFWPYVLPFPLDVRQRKLLWGILQSKVGTDILKSLKLDRRTYQQELIRTLPHSNKSIIEYLKRMVSIGILEQGMERIATEEKTVWMKWYAPTEVGKWLILFLKPPEEVPLEVARDTIEELFKIYSSNIVEVSEKYGVHIDYFHRVLEEHSLRELASKGRTVVPEVVVFGSAALDAYCRVNHLPRPEETTYVEVVDHQPGGMGANVAVALAKLGVTVAFIGKIGSDWAGRLLLKNLIKNNVDVSGLKVSKLESLQTLILFGRRKKRRLLVLGSPKSALSINSPEEVNWEMLEKSKIIYVGEVFLEVASAIASFAENFGKKVVYRPGVPYLRLGLEKLRSVLEHSDFFILNKPGLEALRKTSSKKLKDAGELLNYGPSTVIVTKGPEGCEVWTAKNHFSISVPKHLREKFRVVDPTGAGDSFSAAFIKGLLDGKKLEEAVFMGQVAATITCSRMGASSAFPTAKEVEAFARLE